MSSAKWRPQCVNSLSVVKQLCVSDRRNDRRQAITEPTVT